ncbi:MAG: DUF1294 domain-containing protein [Clostridia bacterium]|nr:DUF1294 domain-containing protein [Clostridia bacterium]
MLIKIIALAIAVMNVLAFALMGIDKHRAKAGKWRIKEATLFLVTGLFGGLGGTLGMFAFRHKTKHWYFKLGFPALLVLQIIIVAIGIKLL